MTEYDAVVYDLDGTLVRLAVDWGAVAEDVIDAYERAGAPVGDGGLWGLMEDAPEHGIEREVEATIAEHELAGARNSRRLALADDLVDRTAATAVCSLNCEAAVRTALDVHDLAEYVDAVVGRDTVDGHKPNPEPLLAAIEAVDATPETSLFVGDSERDERAADRAGVDFAYVRDYAPQRS